MFPLGALRDCLIFPLGAANIPLGIAIACPWGCLRDVFVLYFFRGSLKGSLYFQKVRYT